MEQVTCQLCVAEPITRRYYEGPDCWIADCSICQVPMVVLRRHERVPDDATRARLIAEIARVADQRFGPGAWRLDDMMRRIPDHYHAHARPRYRRGIDASAAHLRV
jgi:hypothetical protein